LRGVDLTIKRGEFTALMGPSGSGKSTLLNLIGALDAPSSGDVWVDGQSIGALSPSGRATLRREHIGFVFQAYNLLPILSAYENAEMVLLARGVPEEERRAQVMEVLEAVGLKGLEQRRPSELSGGQQQRVAVARAIAGSPALVLADEPTANLDSHTGAELIELMRRLNQERGVTFVFATHDPQVMEAARRVVRLVDGEVVEDMNKSSYQG
jgi:putative ABC transport system ATP-binding protein